jgi:hypothetical protein
VKKSKNMPVWLSKMGFGPVFLHRLVKCTAKLNTTVDWLDSLIAPGGLLLVVSQLFAVPVLV